jgi:hypothetical protein
MIRGLFILLIPCLMDPSSSHIWAQNTDNPTLSSSSLLVRRYKEFEPINYHMKATNQGATPDDPL